MRVCPPLTTRIARRGITATAAAGAMLAAGPASTAGRRWRPGLALAAAAGGPAVTLSFTVDSTADSHDASPGNGVCADRQDRCTLRAAIEEASASPAGSSVSISLPAGTYQLTLGSLAETANTITITGAGAISTLIKGNGTFGVLQADAPVTASLSGVTITGGNAGPSGYGGGVLSYGHMTISASAITGNKAAAGGGISNSGGKLTITGSSISGNTATAYGGAGIQNGGLNNLPGSVTVTSTAISNNTASGDGGGILNGQNGHPAAGGPAQAPRRRPGAPSARAWPGARAWPRVRPATSSLAVTVTNSNINGNTSDNAGGGIANDAGTAVITGSTLAGDTVPGAVGGGISSYGTLTVKKSTLASDSSSGGYGGGSTSSPEARRAR